MRRRRTTKAQFEAFKDGFADWQVNLELSEYAVEFELDDLHDAYATVDVDVGNCVAVATFCRYVPDGCAMDMKVAEETGKHEAIHLLMARFRELACSRSATEDAIYAEEERVVRKLEKFL